MSNEELIEEAAKAIYDASWQGLKGEVFSVAYARIAFAVFEKAHASNVSNHPETDISPAKISADAPTDDESLALARLVCDAVYGEPGDLSRASRAVDAILAAGFRRSEVPEPQGEPSDAQAAQQRRISDLRQARDAVSGALAHRLHHTDPDMFFLAVRQMLESARYLVDGYAPGAEDDNRAGGVR